MPDLIVERDEDGNGVEDDGGNGGDAAARLRALLRKAAHAREQPVHGDLGTDLTGPDAERLLPCLGRAAEVGAVLSILARRLPPFVPLVVGPEGVGRRTVVAAALRALRRGGDEVPPVLRGWSGRLVTLADLRLVPRSDRDIFLEAARHRVLLALDRFEEWVGANSPNPWESDGSSEMLVSLLREGVRFVAVSGPGLPRFLAGARNPLAPFLEPVRVGELPEDEMLAAVRLQAPRLAAAHEVRLRGDEVESAWAAACREGHRTMRAVLRRLDRDLAGRACGGDQLRLCAPAAPDAPAAGLADRIEAARRALRQEFQGQDRAIDAICDLLLHRLGPLAPALGRPRAVFLLLGPSGTGKTSMARRIAELVFGADHTYMLSLGEMGTDPQMATYKILGAPPFWTGRIAGSSLCEHLSGAPRSCVVVDEFERAWIPFRGMEERSAPVLDLLMGALGHGELTDAMGNVVSTAESCWFVTSNVRPAKPAAACAGRDVAGTAAHPGETADGSDDAAAEERAEALEALEATPGVSVEFLNRVDRIVLFRPLDAAACARLALRLLSDFAERCGRAGCALEWDRDLPAALGVRLVDSKYNARFARRKMEELVEMPVARLLPAARIRLCVADGTPLPVVVSEPPESDLALS